MAFEDDEVGQHTFFLLAMMCFINAFTMAHLDATTGAITFGIFGFLSGSVSFALSKDGWNRKAWNTIMGVF